MLELQGVTAFYGRVRALHEVSLRVEPGEIVALIGANGAGKTTTLRVVSGLLHPRGGRVLFEDRDITRWPPERIVGAGVAHCPEGRQVFPEMTVLENLEMGAYARREGMKERLEQLFALFPVLHERQRQRAGSLSGGEQQMLAIGRALMSGPRLILFDEPSLGLAPVVVQEVARSIRTLNALGTTVLLVEQNTHLAFGLARRGYVLENGRIVLHGPIAQLTGDERVRRAYLGG
jgi:branched-chain amino acid transport system ATP-binding protein